MKLQEKIIYKKLQEKTRECFLFLCGLIIYDFNSINGGKSARLTRICCGCDGKCEHRT